MPLKVEIVSSKTPKQEVDTPDLFGTGEYSGHFFQEPQEFAYRGFTVISSFHRSQYVEIYLNLSYYPAYKRMRL